MKINMFSMKIYTFHVKIYNVCEHINVIYFWYFLAFQSRFLFSAETSMWCKLDNMLQCAMQCLSTPRCNAFTIGDVRYKMDTFPGKNGHGGAKFIKIWYFSKNSWWFLVHSVKISITSAKIITFVMKIMTFSHEN